RLLFLFGALAIDIERIEVPEDELDGLLESPGNCTFPNFAESAGPEGLDQDVAPHRFRAGFLDKTHEVILAQRAYSMSRARSFISMVTGSGNRSKRRVAPKRRALSLASPTSLERSGGFVQSKWIRSGTRQSSDDSFHV